MPALEGMRVLDLSQYEAGTACTQALAWFGADVVKVERPGRGDPGRWVGRPAGASAYFYAWNSNKRSIAIDLECPEGRELLLSLLPHYDVFVENFGPGVTERLGLSYETLSEEHPGLIYGSIKGFGRSGPYSGYKCFDMVAQAASGAFSVTGSADGPPMRPGPTTADSGTGLQLALGVVAAFVEKLRSGRGQLVELSMQEAMTFFMRSMVALGSRWGKDVVPRRGNGSSAAINLYPCLGAAEGEPNAFVFIMAVSERQWQALAEVVGHPGLELEVKLVEAPARAEADRAHYDKIAAWTGRHDKHEAMRQLCEAGVPASAVLDTQDLFRDPHLQARGFIQSVQHPQLGEVSMLGSPVRLSGGEIGLRRAPELGEHTREVLREDLGLDEETLGRLHESGAVASPDHSARGGGAK